MPIFFDAPVSPDDLTAFVREVPTPSTLALSTLFPTVTVDDNKVDFAEIIQTNRTARFRTFDGRIHVSERDTGSEKRVKLPPLSSSLSMGEYERLQLEFARTSGTNQAALARAVYNDAEKLTREIRNRMELAWGDTLTDGKLTMMGAAADEPTGLEADFGVPAAHIVSAATPWTTVASANVLDDYIAWADVYNATNGFLPGSSFMSLRLQRLLQRNAQLIGAIHGTTSGKTRVTMPEVNDLLSSEGLPPVGNPYDTLLDVDGTSTRVLGDDKVLFFPPNIGDLGYTAYGLSATALELVNSAESDLSFADAPGIVGVVEKSGPPYRSWTFADAVGMPILANAKLLLIADVAA
jgi:hypothetical protein